MLKLKNTFVVIFGTLKNIIKILELTTGAQVFTFSFSINTIANMFNNLFENTSTKQSILIIAIFNIILSETISYF